MPKDGTDDFARAFREAQEPRKRVFKATVSPETLEGVWRQYKRSLSSADLKRIRYHLENGGELRVFVILS